MLCWQRGRRRLRVLVGLGVSLHSFGGSQSRAATLTEKQSGGRQQHRLCAVQVGCQQGAMRTSQQQVRGETKMLSEKNKKNKERPR